MMPVEVLQKYWGYNTFRPLQEDIINSVLNGKDTLALLPTGGGKSICFQVPVLLQEGICLVVSPLIALMKDQVGNLLKRDIKAIAVTSAMRYREMDIALDNCIFGNTKFLYLSPERLQNELFLERLKRMNVSLIAVDEAHCISQWGYDFRPAYLKIADIRKLFPAAPVLALTATATPVVVKDIQQKLLFKKEQVLQKSFERKNLAYVVLHEEDKLRRLLKICNKIKGSGVIYLRNRKKTQEIAAFLKKNNIKADYYHAGLNPETRGRKQESWINNGTRIIVSTNAFGMGIDKPDVRFVVHLDVPDSLEAYFQEAGRAGRDEKKAYAILLYSEADISTLEKNFELSFPPLETIKQVYHALGNYYQLATGSGEGISFDFDISDFCERYKLSSLNVFYSLSFLEKCGYVALSESLRQPSRLMFTASQDDLYKFQVASPAHDSLIKLILRSYGGIFDNYVKISESDLAQRAGAAREKVIAALNKMEQLRLLSYIPQTDKPQLTFLSERVDEKQLIIPKEIYTDRKKIIREKIDEIIRYAREEYVCRSRMLLSYFGETNTQNCGICDVCLQIAKSELSGDEYKNIAVQLKNNLKSTPLNVSELVDSVRGSSENKILKVIRVLMDNEEITSSETGSIKLVTR